MKQKIEIGDRVLLKCKTFKGSPIFGNIIAKVNNKFVIYNQDSDSVYMVCEDELEKYVEPSWKFTDEEKFILDHIDKTYNYIARDESGSLHVFKSEPCKTKDYWYDSTEIFSANASLFNGNLFKTIKWEDSRACDFRRYLDSHMFNGEWEIKFKLKSQKLKCYS